MKRINQCLLLLIISTRFLTINVQNLEAASLIGGQKVNVDEIKYLVSLQRDGEHFCGGSIIGERFILSAAHCVVNEHNKIDNKSIKVVAGTNDLNAKNLKAVKVDVKKIYVPSNYNDLEWETSIPSGDIAVLKLKKSLNIKNNTNLNKLRLPRRNKHYKGKYKSYVGDKVLIAGFGWDKVRVKLLKNKTEYEVGSSTDRLLSATAKVISNSACQEYYTNIIRENELCARVIEHDDDTPQGVCRGDSGGPLVYNHNTIIGVVSGISIGCNENNEPGVYSRVSSYMDFIRNALKDVTDNMLTRTF